MSDKFSGCRVVTIINKGYIQSINREGPILRKSIPTAVAYSLVNRGYTVFEHHPVDQKIKIRLTKKNFNDEHRFDSMMGVGKPEEKPVIVDTNKNIATPEQAKAAEEILNSPVRVTTVVEPPKEEPKAEPVEEKKPEVVEEKVEETVTTTTEDPNAGLTRKQRRELRRQQMLAEQQAQKENNSETTTVVESESNK